MKSEARRGLRGVSPWRGMRERLMRAQRAVSRNGQLVGGRPTGGKARARWVDITFDWDVSEFLARSRHIVCELHPKKVIHLRAEGPFDAERHFGGERRLAVQEVRKRSPAHFQH